MVTYMQNNKWYALCEYKGKGKNKKPYQIQASQHKEKLLDRKDSLELEYPDREYAVKLTTTFDKERKWSGTHPLLLLRVYK